METSLEERLAGLRDLKDSLASSLRSADYGRPSRILSGGHRYTKHDLVDYLREDGELEQDFDAKLYRAINKTEMKRIYYGVLCLNRRIPKEITERLDGWERVMLYAGIWFNQGKFDYLAPLPELVQELIKKGYDGLHQMHMVKYHQGSYRRPLKIPGSQDYRKDGKVVGNIKSRRVDLPYLLNLMSLEGEVSGTPEGEDISERIAVMFDSCSDEELRRLTELCGASKLGEYAVN